MLDKVLANLILDHGEELLPYLKLRAYYELKGDSGKVIVYNSEVSLADIKRLQISGYVKLEETFDNQSCLIIKEDNNWLGYPPSTNKQHKRVKVPYLPKHLVKLAGIVGYPHDWEKNLGKYRSLYFALIRKHPDYIVESVAEWVAREYPDYKLNTLLTESFFVSLKDKMERPKNKIQGRGTSGEATHDETQAALRELGF